MTFGMKQKGFAEYYLCEGAIRTSNKGYRILTITGYKEISKTAYYKLDCPRFNTLFDPSREIHEVGHGYMFDALAASH